MISNRINICCIYIVSVLIYLINQKWVAVYIFLFCPPRVGICNCHSTGSSVPSTILSMYMLRFCACLTLLFEEVM